MTGDHQEEVLPGMPAVVPAKKPRVREGETVSRYSVQSRRLCDACVLLIHQYGQGAAPYPKAARWRIAAPDKPSRYLCNDHKENRL